MAGTIYCWWGLREKAVNSGKSEKIALSFKGYILRNEQELSGKEV